MYRYDRHRSLRTEETYLKQDIVEQRRQFISMLRLQPGMHIVDIGSGPGLLALEMAQQLGDGGLVVGVEPSEHMRELAQARCEEVIRSGRVELKAGDANNLPVPSADFDVAVSTQVLEYVPDIDGALKEINRAVKPDGMVAILDTDWDSLVWHTSDRERTRRVLEDWDQHVAHPHLPQTLRGRLQEAGFTGISCDVIPIVNLTYSPDVFSHSAIENIRSFVSSRSGVAKEEADAWAQDLREAGRADNYFFSVNRYVFRARKARST